MMYWIMLITQFIAQSYTKKEFQANPLQSAIKHLRGDCSFFLSRQEHRYGQTRALDEGLDQSG